MAHYVVIHARYNDAQWGLFRDEKLVDHACDESKKISKNFIPLLDELLNKHKLSLSDLSFIGAHQGPAPFTTLRVCLTSVNGFAYATGIPLVGINGLDALLDDYKKTDMPTIVLLHAFNKEVYYGIHDPKTETTEFGCEAAESFILKIAHDFQTPLTFLGNGATMYQEIIKRECAERAMFLEHELVSLDSIARSAFAAWKKQETHHELTPLYLKNYSAVMAPRL